MSSFAGLLALLLMVEEQDTDSETTISPRLHRLLRLHKFPLLLIPHPLAVRSAQPGVAGTHGQGKRCGVCGTCGVAEFSDMDDVLEVGMGF